MQTITLVTGNPNKLKEYRALLPNDASFTFTSHDFDLPEIQSLDLAEIVHHKLMGAYKRLRGPVAVEDVSAGLKKLDGLPGPFIKFFEQKLGADALFKLSPDDSTTIRCVVGYYDGKKELFGTGEITGLTVAPRGENGFGFDKVVIPDGESRTMAEMSYEEKNAISHRFLAVKSLIDQLTNPL